MEVDSLYNVCIHLWYIYTDVAAASDDSADVTQWQDPENAHLGDGDACAQLDGRARRLDASDDLISDAASVSSDCEAGADDIA